MNLTPAQMVLAQQRAASELRSDPLSTYRHASWAARMLTEQVARGVGVYWHAGNNGGKTRAGCALDVAYCTGRDELDGVPIPVLRPPVAWGLGVETYKLGGPAAIGTIVELLGDWPYRAVRTPEGVSQFTIKHRLARDESEWSVLYVYPYNGPRPEGPRLDGWHCDEVPPADYLSTLDSRKKAGRMLRGYITATPLKRSAWAPVLKLYPATPGVVERGVVRIESSVYDNTFLMPAELAEIEQRARRHVDWEARLYGRHTDTTGDNPFIGQRARLEEWLARCVPPRLEPVTIDREVDTRDGRDTHRVQVRLEVWAEHDPRDAYFGVIDVGKGIDDGKHDPDCLQVWSRRRRMLVARYNGYLGGLGIATLAAEVGQRYGMARLYPLVTGGYGEIVLSTLGRIGYRKIAYKERPDRPGVWQTTLGVNETAALRASWVEAMQSALAENSLTILSREVLESFRGLVVDESGKVLAGPEYHDEDWSCGGYAAWILAQASAGMAPICMETPAERSVREDLARVRAMREFMSPASMDDLEVPERW